MTGLEELSISWGYHLTDKGFAYLSGLKRLRILDVDHSEMTDASLESIGKLTNLEELRIAGVGFTDRGRATSQRAYSLEIPGARRGKSPDFRCRPRVLEEHERTGGPRSGRLAGQRQGFGEASRAEELEACTPDFSMTRRLVGRDCKTFCQGSPLTSDPFQPDILELRNKVRLESLTYIQRRVRPLP